MKSTSVIWLGANAIGSADDSIFVTQGTYVECLYKLSDWLTPRSIPKRFDIVIARSEEEVRGGLRIRSRATLTADADNSGMLESLTKLMEAGDGGS